MPSGVFTFNLDNFQIKNTLSAHTDTVWAALTVLVGPPEAQPISAFTQTQLGNLNNGIYKTGLSCANLAIPPGYPVVFNYLIVNAQAAAAQSAEALKIIQAIDWIGVGGLMAKTPSLNLPRFASCIQTVLDQYSNILDPIKRKGSCDGLVAAEQASFTYDELLSFSSRNPYFTQSTTHVRPSGGSGCNSKGSLYIVNWSMMQVANVPVVTQMPLGTPDTKDTALYLLKRAGFTGSVPPNQAGSNRRVTHQSLTSPPTQSQSEPVVLTTVAEQP